MPERKTLGKIKMIWILLAGIVVLALLVLFFQNKTNGRIVSGGRVRKYLIYVPESYDPNTASPLVFSFHGFVQWPAHQRNMTGWNTLADEHGFIVVYPKGTGFPLRWNIMPNENDQGSMSEDPVFIRELLEHLSHSYNIDQTRIYANGMSNGGGMSDLLACELWESFAAIGGVAGAYRYPRENCDPPRPVPVIAFHGQDDQVVPYSGGRSSRDDQIEFLSVEDWAASWAEHNSCATTPVFSEITNEIQRLSYSDCWQDNEVILYRVGDGGHTWPGGEKLPVWIAGYTNQDINATALMWEFFSKYSGKLE